MSKAFSAGDEVPKPVRAEAKSITDRRKVAEMKQRDMLPNWLWLLMWLSIPPVTVGIVFGTQHILRALV